MPKVLEEEAAASTPSCILGKVGLRRFWAEHEVGSLGLTLGTSADGWIDLAAFFAIMAVFAYIALSFVLDACRSRTPPPGLCSKCRYNLAGNTLGICPECGMAMAGSSN